MTSSAYFRFLSLNSSLFIFILTFLGYLMKWSGVDVTKLTVMVFRIRFGCKIYGILLMSESELW